MIPFGLYIQDFKEEHPPSLKLSIKYVTASIRSCNQFTCNPPERMIGIKLNTDLIQNGNFPNCIGALDGKHIIMHYSPNSHSLFYNYKGFFSIVLIALVDADYHFIYIDVGNYGSNGDSGIFKNSALGETFTGKLLNIPGPKRLPGYPEGGALPQCIVADEAFPLRMDLM